MTPGLTRLAQLPLASQMLCYAVPVAAVSGQCLPPGAMATRRHIDADQLAATRGLQQSGLLPVEHTPHVLSNHPGASQRQASRRNPAAADDRVGDTLPFPTDWLARLRKPPGTANRHAESGQSAC